MKGAGSILMKKLVAIRILEKENNRRGDLFGRLMADLFVALGYEQPRLNVHKSGRELDLSADHRLEPRRAIGECKATTKSIGGDELNKFAGAVDVERQGKVPVTGYFISLAGFRETAIEQEKKRRRKIILISGPKVVEELVEGRILIAREQATERAGRFCENLDELSLDPESELLAHERGWIWAVYYTQDKARTHFVLIHGDGTPLARELADEVAASDRECGGVLQGLTCLNRAARSAETEEPGAEEALAAYKRYLASECGDIQLDGLPADGNVGPTRLRLENLFVPLHLDLTVREGKGRKKMTRQAVGGVLAQHPRLAILASPGGGKSTLIKRLAVAYSDPERREQVADDLAKRDWLPLFFRCRELRSLARGSFAEILEALSQHEVVRQHAAAFRAHVDRMLLEGRVLLLVDGLDEISDAGDRAAFVCTLRTALQAYPGVAIVVTSREAGFRHVAAHLASVCSHATLSDFDGDDIRRLTVAWHQEVVGDSEKVRTDAEELAATIIKNDRIRRLAVNPLLLTTLLLVKRWVGTLPTRRAVLYGKAVEVLLMTWNTEGHEPIPEEEALPQLCYVASAMMLGGVQKISRPRLAALLKEARDALPTELGYVSDSVEEFIHRIEDRSSLLMMTGQDVEDGQLVEFFEFRHLTFQEFLAARSMVEGWNPGRKEGDTLVSVLEPHFEREEWREVIPLAAVLGGKATEALIQRLTDKVDELNPDWISERALESSLIFSLGNCLADEVAARPQIIQSAIRQLVRVGEAWEGADFTPMLARGRFGADLRNEAWEAFLAQTGSPNALQALAESVWWKDIEPEYAVEPMKAADRVVKLLKSPGVQAQCEGALGCMNLCFQLPDVSEPKLARSLCEVGALLLNMVFSDQLRKQITGSWALAWLGTCRVWTPPAEPDVLGQLFRLWQKESTSRLPRFACWALSSQLLVDREGEGRCSTIPRGDSVRLLDSYSGLDSWFEKPAVLVVAWYGNLLDDKELVKRAQTLLRKCNPSFGQHQTLTDLLGLLGAEP
jgi:hypothetical protein